MKLIDPSKYADYEEGYQDGGSSAMADWDIALSDVLPDGVDPMPSQVREYIVSLQEFVRTNVQNRSI